MPYEYILANLLAENQGAVGALFLDESGETVEVACVDHDPSEMKLLGAYVGIYLRQIARFLEPEDFGELEALHIESQNLHVFARPVAEGYFLVLAQRAPALTALAERSLARASSQLVRELFPETLSAGGESGSGSQSSPDTGRSS